MRKSIKIAGIIILVIIALFLIISMFSSSAGVSSVSINTTGDTCVLNTSVSLPQNMPNTRVTIWAYDENGNTIGSWEDGPLMASSYEGNTGYWITRSFTLETNNTTNKPIHIKYLTYDFSNDNNMYSYNYTVSDSDNVSYN